MSEHHALQWMRSVSNEEEVPLKAIYSIATHHNTPIIIDEFFNIIEQLTNPTFSELLRPVYEDGKLYWCLYSVEMKDYKKIRDGIERVVLTLKENFPDVGVAIWFDTAWWLNLKIDETTIAIIIHTHQPLLETSFSIKLVESGEGSEMIFSRVLKIVDDATKWRIC